MITRDEGLYIEMEPWLTCDDQGGGRLVFLTES